MQRVNELHMQHSQPQKSGSVSAFRVEYAMHMQTQLRDGAET